tara:strand:- start:265 stop:576 length:312 start_codon:yes stop_codon:yes gene_type:complete
LKKLFIVFILSTQLFATNTFVIDVRTDDEFNSGHVESAINIEWQDIFSVANMIDEDDQVFLYCRSGNRSQKATNILIDIGYKNVINLGSLKDASEFLNEKIVQ